MTRAELDRLGRDLPSLAAIDAELARRGITPAALDAELSTRGLVRMKMTMAKFGRRPGDRFVCSERIAQGHDVYGSAVRVTS